MVLKSKWFKGLIWALILTLASVLILCLRDLASAQGTVLQDLRSGTVIFRPTRLLLRGKPVVLYRGANYNAKLAVWQHGAAIAYKQPLEVGQLAAVQDSQGNRYLLALADLDPTARKATFRIINQRARIRHQAELAEDQKIPVTDDVQIPWSFHTSSAVYLYADEYLRKPERDLYRVAFLPDRDLNTDVDRLPKDIFTAIPH